jgi:hypothetical protein
MGIAGMMGGKVYLIISVIIAASAIIAILSHDKNG